MNLKRVFTQRTPEIMDQRRAFSILAPVFQSSRGYELVFEERSPHITQPGEISFPGGAVEDGETLAEAAVRETAEELGLPTNRIHLWGQLDILPFYDGMVLYPFIGELDIKSLDELAPNGDEVSRVFSVPLYFFLDHEPEVYRLPLKVELVDDFPYDKIPGGRDYPWRRGKDKIRFYDTDEAVIWGLTARIIHNLVRIYQKTE